MFNTLNLGGLAAAMFMSMCMNTTLAPASLPEQVLNAQNELATVITPEKVIQQEQKALAAHLSKKYSQPLPLVQRIVKAAYSEGKKHELSPLLVLAIIEKESSLKPTAGNSYGAQGLMQVVPRYHREKLKGEKHPDGLKNPETNIRVGSKVIAEYLKLRKGNLDAALAYYSGGAREYAPKVKAFRASLESVIHKSRMELFASASAKTNNVS